MEERFEVVYNGQMKAFDEKSRALSHGLAMELLGFEVDVYYRVKILSVEMRVKIYQTFKEVSRLKESVEFFLKGGIKK